MDKRGHTNITVGGSIFVALALFSAIMFIAGGLIDRYLDQELGGWLIKLGGLILLVLLVLALVTWLSERE